MKFGEHPFDEDDDAEKPKRGLGFLGFIFFYLIVCGALVALLIRFTRNWILAIVLVGFMVAYMSVVAWLAIRREKDKDL